MEKVSKRSAEESKQRQTRSFIYAHSYKETWKDAEGSAPKEVNFPASTSRFGLTGVAKVSLKPDARTTDCKENKNPKAALSSHGLILYLFTNIIELKVLF